MTHTDEESRGGYGTWGLEKGDEGTKISSYLPPPGFSSFGAQERTTVPRAERAAAHRALLGPIARA